jgi:protein-disulfide isomerase
VLAIGDGVVYATGPTDQDMGGCTVERLEFGGMRMRALLAVVAALTVVAFTAGCTRSVDGRAVAGDAPGPGVALTGDGFGIELGSSADAKAEIFIEMQCPHCAHFFGDYVADITEHVNDGNLAFTIRPVTFLDSGTNDYSARASNAVFLVAQQDGASPSLVMEYIAALYDNMLSTMTAPTDDDLAGIAGDVGVSEDTVDRIAAAEPALDADEMNEANLDAMDQIGASGTPTVYDLGAKKDVDISDEAWLDEIVGK